ncbi:hypothetical protein [Polyangium sp. 6x1]|nr:hypothetical protein [Polyangium sp. 6x1]MDI1446302.1 hypothetical protein [Polyangium sp. 6x1]
MRRVEPSACARGPFAAPVDGTIERLVPPPGHVRDRVLVLVAGGI